MNITDRAGLRTWLQAALTLDVTPAEPGAPWRPQTRAEVATVAVDLRDGLLRRVVGDVVVSAAAPDDVAVRAAALALCLPPGAVLLGAAAAWVHRGGPPPTEVEVAATRIAPRGRGLTLVPGRLPAQARVVAVAGLHLLAEDAELQAR